MVICIVICSIQSGIMLVLCWWVNGLWKGLLYVVYRFWKSRSLKQYFNSKGASMDVMFIKWSPLSFRLCIISPEWYRMTHMHVCVLHSWQSGQSSICIIIKGLEELEKEVVFRINQWYSQQMRNCMIVNNICFMSVTFLGIWSFFFLHSFSICLYCGVFVYTQHASPHI